MNKYTLITILVLILGIVGGYIIKPEKVTEVVNNFGSTGSSFNLLHEYVDPGSVLASATISTTTITTQVASSSPIFMAALSTTSISVLTAGVSDVRLNIIAHSTTTAEGKPVIDIVIRERANNGTDHYMNLIGTSDTDGILLHKSYQWTTSTTTDDTTEPDNFSAGSFQISNINSPYTVFDIGSDSATDFHIEIVKAVPNQ